MAGTEPILRDFPAGATVFQQHDKGDFMYIVRSGTVKLTLTSLDVEMVDTGGFIGEMALLQNDSRSLSAVAQTACSLQHVDRDTFYNMVHQTPFFAINVMRVMARRLRHMDGRVDSDTRIGRNLFRGETSAELLRNAKFTRVIPAGAFILRQNEEGEEMYCVRRGSAELRVNSVVVETLGPGAVLGEMALIEDAPRSATAVATSECELLVFDRERFEYLLAMTPDFAIFIMQVLARRLRAINKAIAAGH